MPAPSWYTAAPMRNQIAFFRAAIPALSLSVLLPASAFAQGFFSQDNFIKGGDETLVLNLGGILNQFDTVLRLDGGGIRGDAVNLEANGLEANVSSFEASATWRFWSRNRFDAKVFTAKRTGSHVTDRQFTIDGHVIDVDFTLAAEARDQFLLFDYRRSLVKKTKLELAGVIGIYGGEFEFDLSATGTEQGQSVTKNASASTPIPLPLLGVTIDWYASPRWRLAANIEGVKAKVGDVDGWALVTGANAAYMLIRRFGVGLSFLYSDVDVDISKDSFNGDFAWKVSSVSAYGQFAF